ncbi:MAG: DinB family protein, partial [Trueperaceae bacterium]
MELLTLEQFYNHWQGHRRLTIRTIEKFPDDKLFSYNVEPMRTFGEIAKEILEVEHSIIHGIVSGEWKWELKYNSVDSKQELLAAFEELGKQTKENWLKLSTERL